MDSTGATTDDPQTELSKKVSSQKSDTRKQRGRATTNSSTQSHANGNSALLHQLHQHHQQAVSVNQHGDPLWKRLAKDKQHHHNTTTTTTHNGTASSLSAPPSPAVVSQSSSARGSSVPTPLAVLQLSSSFAQRARRGRKQQRSSSSSQHHIWGDGGQLSPSTNKNSANHNNNSNSGPSSLLSTTVDNSAGKKEEVGSKKATVVAGDTTSGDDVVVPVFGIGVEGDRMEYIPPILNPSVDWNDPTIFEQGSVFRLRRYKHNAVEAEFVRFSDDLMPQFMVAIGVLSVGIYLCIPFFEKPLSMIEYGFTTLSMVLQIIAVILLILTHIYAPVKRVWLTPSDSKSGGGRRRGEGIFGGLWCCLGGKVDDEDVGEDAGPKALPQRQYRQRMTFAAQIREWLSFFIITNCAAAATFPSLSYQDRCHSFATKVYEFAGLSEDVLLRMCGRAIPFWIPITYSLYAISEKPRLALHVIGVGCLFVLFVGASQVTRYEGRLPDIDQAIIIPAVVLQTTLCVLAFHATIEKSRRKQFEDYAVVANVYSKLNSQRATLKEYVATLIPSALSDKLLSSVQNGTSGDGGGGGGPQRSLTHENANSTCTMVDILNSDSIFPPARFRFGANSISVEKLEIHAMTMLIELEKLLTGLCREAGMDRISLFGDMFCTASNLITDVPDHAYRGVVFALTAVDAIQKAGTSSMKLLSSSASMCVQIRAGVHSGPLMGHAMGMRGPIHYGIYGEALTGATHCVRSCSAFEVIASTATASQVSSTQESRRLSVVSNESKKAAVVDMSFSPLNRPVFTHHHNDPLVPDHHIGSSISPAATTSFSLSKGDVNNPRHASFSSLAHRDSTLFSFYPTDRTTSIGNFPADMISKLAMKQQLVSASDKDRPSVFSIGGASSSPMNEDDPSHMQLSPSTGPTVRLPGSMSYDVLLPSSGSNTAAAAAHHHQFNPFEERHLMCLVERIVCEAAQPSTTTISAAIDPTLTPNTSTPLSQKTNTFDGGDQLSPHTLAVDQQQNEPTTNQIYHQHVADSDDEENDEQDASQLVAISSSRGKRSGVMSLSTDGSLHAPPSGGINSSDDEEEGGSEPPVSSRFAASMSCPPEREERDNSESVMNNGQHHNQLLSAITTNNNNFEKIDANQIISEHNIHHNKRNRSFSEAAGSGDIHQQPILQPHLSSPALRDQHHQNNITADDAADDEREKHQPPSLGTNNLYYPGSTSSLSKLRRKSSSRRNSRTPRGSSLPSLPEQPPNSEETVCTDDDEEDGTAAVVAHNSISISASSGAAAVNLRGNSGNAELPQVMPHSLGETPELAVPTADADRKYEAAYVASISPRSRFKVPWGPTSTVPGAAGGGGAPTPTTLLQGVQPHVGSRHHIATSSHSQRQLSSPDARSTSRSSSDSSVRLLNILQEDHQSQLDIEYLFSNLEVDYKLIIFQQFLDDKMEQQFQLYKMEVGGNSAFVQPIALIVVATLSLTLSSFASMYDSWLTFEEAADMSRKNLVPVTREVDNAIQKSGVIVLTIGAVVSTVLAYRNVFVYGWKSSEWTRKAYTAIVAIATIGTIFSNGTLSRDVFTHFIWLTVGMICLTTQLMPLRSLQISVFDGIALLCALSWAFVIGAYLPWFILGTAALTFPGKVALNELRERSERTSFMNRKLSSVVVSLVKREELIQQRILTAVIPAALQVHFFNKDPNGKIDLLSPKTTSTSHCINNNSNSNGDFKSILRSSNVLWIDRNLISQSSTPNYCTHETAIAVQIVFDFVSEEASRQKELVNFSARHPDDSGDVNMSFSASGMVGGSMSPTAGHHVTASAAVAMTTPRSRVTSTTDATAVLASATTDGSSNGGDDSSDSSPFSRTDARTESDIAATRSNISRSRDQTGRYYGGKFNSHPHHPHHIHHRRAQRRNAASVHPLGILDSLISTVQQCAHKAAMLHFFLTGEIGDGETGGSNDKKKLKLSEDQQIRSPLSVIRVFGDSVLLCGPLAGPPDTHNGEDGYNNPSTNNPLLASSSRRIDPSAAARKRPNNAASAEGSFTTVAFLYLLQQAVGRVAPLVSVTAAAAHGPLHSTMTSGLFPSCEVFGAPILTAQALSGAAPSGSVVVTPPIASAAKVILDEIKNFLEPAAATTSVSTGPSPSSFSPPAPQDHHHRQTILHAPTKADTQIPQPLASSPSLPHMVPVDKQQQQGSSTATTPSNMSQPPHHHHFNINHSHHHAAFQTEYDDDDPAECLEALNFSNSNNPHPNGVPPGGADHRTMYTSPPSSREAAGGAGGGVVDVRSFSPGNVSLGSFSGSMQWNQHVRGMNRRASTSLVGNVLPVRQGTSSNNIIVAAQVAIVDPLTADVLQEPRSSFNQTGPLSFEDNAAFPSFERLDVNFGHTTPVPQPTPQQPTPAVDIEESAETFKQLACFIASCTTFSKEQRWKLKEADKIPNDPGSGVGDNMITSTALLLSTTMDTEATTTRDGDQGKQQHPKHTATTINTTTTTTTPSTNSIQRDGGEEEPNDSGDTVAGVGLASEERPHQQPTTISATHTNNNSRESLSRQEGASFAQVSGTPLRIIRVQLLHFS